MSVVRDDEGMMVGYLLSVLLFGIVMGLFICAFQFLGEEAGKEGAETLRRAISRAAVECYAIEGRYPPSVGYLEDNYGIQIDRDHYHVFYNGFASNILPEITVTEVIE